MKHISFPSIEQYRNIVANVNRQFNFVGLDAEGNAIYDPTLPKPVLTFKGTVKIHGTNSGVCFKPSTGELWSQSKENVITPTKDNAGFAFFVETNKQAFLELFDEIITSTGINKETNTFCIYGEWAGKSIQSGVAMVNVGKAFYIFGVKVSPNDNANESETVVDGVRSTAYWVDYSYLRKIDSRIFNVDDFPTYNIEIDFNRPELAQNLIIERTIQVEDECPVAKAFGFEGIGEGLVWSTTFKDTVLRFKSKGEKHSKSKVKVLREVDEAKSNLIHEIADKVTPSWRLSQAIEKSCNLLNGGVLDRKLLGDYIRLVIADITKEDLDIIAEAGLELKDITKTVSDISRRYFFEQELL